MKRVLISLLLLWLPAAFLLMRLRPRRGWHKGEVRRQGTGSHNFLADSRIVEFPFDKYLIKVRLSPTNEFLGIEEVTVNKDFLSYSQQLATLSTLGYHDVEEYYRVEEE